MIAGQRNFFGLFICFERSVYYWLFVSLLVVSLTVTAVIRPLKTFFDTLWKYSTVLLSKSQSVPMNTFVERLISSVWLLSFTVFLAAFSGLLRDRLRGSEAIDWIDSWKDLYEKVEYFDQIKAHEANDISIYVEKFGQEPIAKAFNSKMKCVGTEEIFQNNEDVIKRKMALIEEHRWMTIIKYDLIGQGYREDLDFHMSVTGGGNQPRHLITNRLRLNESMAHILDLV